jgi:alpha-beta hydrolase superfamily lysophospholipase
LTKLLLFAGKVTENSRPTAERLSFAVPLAGGTGAALLAAPKQMRDLQQDHRQVLVILAHDLGADCTFPHWHWIEALVHQGMHVLSIDWDGHGVSTSSVLDLQSATRSLPLVLQKIYGEPGLVQFRVGRPGPKCFLMGHSAGAMLALLCATRPDFAEVLSGIIAVSPSIVLNDLDAQMEPFLFLRPNAWLHDLVGRVPYYGLRGVLPMSARKRASQFPVRKRIGITHLEQLRLFVQETFEHRKVLRDVCVPVLWLHGGRDRFVPLDDAEKLMSEIPSALFCHIDDNRGHLRMALSSEIPNYAARFIDSCLRTATFLPREQLNATAS